MSKYVVTGATSFIGEAVVKELLKKQHQVYVIVRPTSKKRQLYQESWDCHPVFLDLDHIEQCESIIKNADCFLHFGWDGVAAKGRSNSEIQAQNVNHSLMCVKTASKLGCKSFLFAGSQAEYGIKYDVIREDTVCEPILEYGKGKLDVLKMAQPLAQSLGLKYYHARIFSVYGPGDHPWTLVSSSIEKFLKGEEFKASTGEQTWNFLYIDDAAHALVSLVESNAESGVYNIAGEDTRPLKDFIVEIYRSCGGKGSLSLGAYIPIEVPNNLKPDITKLTNIIGPIMSVAFADGIKRIIEKRENGGVQ